MHRECITMLNFFVQSPWIRQHIPRNTIQNSREESSIFGRAFCNLQRKTEVWNQSIFYLGTNCLWKKLFQVKSNFCIRSVSCNMTLHLMPTLKTPLGRQTTKYYLQLKKLLKYLKKCSILASAYPEKMSETTIQ